MKNLLLIASLLFVIMQTSLMAQIKVNSSGYVGINNTNPTFRLDVAGTVKFTNSSQTVSFDGPSFGPSTTGVGLGTSATRWATFYTVYGYFTYAPVTTSDLNYKTNIINLTGMNEKLKLLRAVSYQYKTDIPGLVIDKAKNGTQFGFIAQELKEVFPEIVKEDNGVLGISYTELIPVLVQALREQQEEIDALNARILILEKANQ